MEKQIDKISGSLLKIIRIANEYVLGIPIMVTHAGKSEAICCQH